MAYNKNLNIGPNNVVNISGSLITLTGSLYGSEVSGTTAQFTSFTASNFKVENDLFVSGGLTVGKYIQMLPVGAEVLPANTTASYIYTSGSTNDVYFTQYQPGTGFKNTSRYRWLEGGLSTGLLYGGTLSTVTGTTTFNLSSGSGYIVTFNATTTLEPYPTIKYVNWTSSVSQSIGAIATSQITYIAIDQDGQILQNSAPPTAAQFKDRIYLGRILHQTGSITNGTINTPVTAYAVTTNNADFIRAIGPLKINGHYLAQSGSSLSLIKSAGDSYVEGRNYNSNPDIPNLIIAAEDPAVTVSKIYRQHMSGGNPVINTGIANAGFTTVDPANYQDTNGLLLPVDGNSYTVQRVYWFPKSVNRALYVYYGQAKYASMDDAVTGINTENFTEGDNTKGSSILVGFLVMRGTVANFDTPSTGRIYQAGVLRGGAGSGGGGAAGTTLPAGLNTQVQFNDVGSFGADSGFTFNKTTKNLTVTGTGSFGSLTTSDGIVATGTGSFGSLSTSGSVTAAGTGSFGTLTTSDGITVTGTGSFGALTTAGPLTASAIYVSGDVGIGTLLPNAKLDVNGNTIISGNLTVTGIISGSSYLGVSGSGGSTTPGGINTSIQFNSGSTFSGSTNLIYDYTTNTLSGTAAQFVSVTASFNGNLNGNVNGTSSYASNAGLLNGTSSANFALLASNNTFSGINSFTSQITGTSAYFSNDVYINGTASIGFLNTISQSSLLIGDKYITILSGAADHVSLDGSGILWGSGSSGPTVNELGANAHLRYRNSLDKLEIFPGLYVSGSTSISENLIVTGSITELSTRRIKTNIKSLNNELITISKLNPVSYTRLDDGRKEYGFISEEVKEVYPEFVVGEGISYPKMVSILVSAVKELTDKVEKQQNEIEILKNTRGNL